MSFDINLYQLPKGDSNILDLDPDILSNFYINLPLLNLGYHCFYKQTLEEKLRKIDLTKDFYYIVIPFELKNVERERMRDTQEKQDIMTATRQYLKVKDNLDSDFYKIWEILSIFNFTTNSVGKPIQDLNINIVNNSNLQIAVKLFCMKIDSLDLEDVTSNDLDFNNPDYIEKFNTKFYDIIICNDSLNLSDSLNYSYKETLNYHKIIGQIFYGISNLKNTGKLIVRIDDMFTEITVKLLDILNNLFETVHIYKPYTVRNIYSEKYIIAYKFDRNKYENTKFITKSIKLIKHLFDIPSNKYINNIYTQYKISDTSLFNYIAVINTQFKNLQYKYTNILDTYVASENYFGEDYQQYLEIQNKSTDYWLSMFFPINNNDKEKIKSIFLQKIKSNINKIKTLI